MHDAVFDPNAEVRLIGAAMVVDALRPEARAALLASVAPEEFGDPVHAGLWRAARAISRQGGLIDPRTLADAVGTDPGFARWGGFRELLEVWDKADLHGVEAMAASVRDRALRRRLLACAEDQRRAVHDTTVPAFDLAARTQAAMAALVAEGAPAATALVTAPRAAEEALDAIDAAATGGRPRGLMCGLKCFDHRLGGFRPGWLVVLAGRPSMGKTALARSAAMATATRNPDRLVVFFALEMDRIELADRMLSELSHLDGDGIFYKDIGGDRLGPEERARLRALAARVPANFVIDDSPVLSVDHIRRRLHAMAGRERLGLVVIDYLQIMQKPEARGRNEASVIGEMTQQLKQLARELGVCILLLSQLNRAVEGRDDKRPHLSDLRDSGAIEQDANAVLLCYREAYYLERNPPRAKADLLEWEIEMHGKRRDLDVLAPKVRGGQAGSDRQLYFAEVDHVADPQP